MWPLRAGWGKEKPTVFKKVEVLSGGEKSRLGLVRLLLDPANLLLLDEPTTHLDMSSVETLIQALKGFDGTICFISHDVYFMRQLASQVLHVNNGKVTWYPGDYDYFLHRKAQEKSEEAELFRAEEKIEAVHHSSVPHPSSAAPSKPVPSGFKTPAQKRQEAEERQVRSRLAREKAAQQKELDDLKQQEAWVLEEFAQTSTHQDQAKMAKLGRQLADLQKRIAELGGGLPD